MNAKPRVRYRAAVALVAAVCFVVSGCATSPPQPTPTVADRLGIVAQELVDAGGVGVILRVDNGDDPVIELVRQSDWAAADRALEPDDSFRVASNTKTMIATIVLQLVDEGDVALDEPIETYLPGDVPNGASITVRMLLNHTSGLDDFLLTSPGRARLSGADVTPARPEELLALGAALPPVGEPGKAHYYSNTNYIVVGLLLERVTGLTLEELIERRIIEPLGLHDTYLATENDGATNASLAHGFEPVAADLAPILPDDVEAGFSFVGPELNRHVNTTVIDASWAWAAGAVVSTASDWSRFGKAVQSGELLPTALLEEMRTTVDFDRYGLGLEKRGTSCGVAWGHSGGLPGYSSRTFTDTDGTRTAAIFVTTNFGLDAAQAEGKLDALVHAAVCTMFDEPIPEL